jgi:hydroxymethylbilane synthase
MKLIIGTRSSELALWQANFVKSELENNYPDISVELKHVKTKGDKILDVALDKIGDKGLFTKELEVELLNGTIDLAVHSLKDLQTELPEGLKISTICKRHDVRDVFISNNKNMGLLDIPENATIATGSLRRRSQVLNLRPDLNIVDLRGNINTRIQKYLDSDWTGIILACAGVERIGLTEHIGSYLDTDQILPAVGQGALGIEIATGREDLKEILSKINDKETEIAVTAERAFLRGLGGGCQTPIAAFAERIDGKMLLKGLVASVDGRRVLRKECIFEDADANDAGKYLAEYMLEFGAEELLRLY